MGITTESITSMLEKVVELLELDDDAEVKVTLSLSLITLALRILRKALARVSMKSSILPTSISTV